MIYLIISLTFSTALVFATIYKAEAYGSKDQASGVIRTSDTFVVRTESVMPCSVSGSFTNGSYKQMSCSAGTPTSCSYTYVFTNATGRIDASVMEATSGLTANVSAYVDNMAPTISSIATTSLGNKAKISYIIHDAASTYYPDKCSGFKKVELFINNQLVNKTNYTVGMCDVNGDITGTIAEYVGTVNTSLRITDYMDLTANITGDQVFIDSQKPKIRSTTKVLRPGTEFEIKEVSTNSTFVMDVDVTIDIDDNAIPESNGVFANFTSFDHTLSIDQSNQAANCERNGWANNYTCTFSGVKLSPSTLRPSFIVSVTDQTGNFANATITPTFTEAKGANIGSAKVYKAGTEEEMRIISTNTSKERSVDIGVGVTDSLAVINASGNFAEIHRSLGASQNNKQGTCTENNQTTNQTLAYDCLFKGLKLNPSTGTPKIVIRVTDEIGKTVEKNVSLSFTVVNNAGTIMRLGPEASYCISEVCYVKKGGGNNITADISSSSTFNDSTVKIQAANAVCTHPANWVCQANANFNENDKVIKLIGTDDLGNPITGEVNIVVDSGPPKILNLTLATPDNTSTDDLHRGDTLIINLTVKDNTPITAMADFTGLGDNTTKFSLATCQATEEEPEISQCTWSQSITINKYKIVNIPINITDASGQETRKEVQVTIKELTNETPNFWNTTAKTSPKRMNQRLLVYYPKKVYSNIIFTKNTDSAKIIDAALMACMPKIDNSTGTPTTHGLGMLTPEIITMSDNKEKILSYVEIPSAVYNITTLEWNCTISLTTSTKTMFFQTPEIESYNLTIILDKSPLMSEPVAEEAARLRKELNGTLPKAIRTIDAWMSRVAAACQAYEGLQLLTSSCAAAEIVAPFAPAKEAFKQCSDAAAFGSKGIMKALGWACECINCKLPWQNNLIGWWTKMPWIDKLPFEKLGQFAGLDYTGNINSKDDNLRRDAAATMLASSMNPQDSWVAAAISLCPSGLVHSLKKSQVLKCQKLSCLENDVPAGLPPSECEKNYKYSDCQYNTGAVFDLIGTATGAGIATYTLNQIKEYISDPIAIGGMLLSIFGCKVFPIHAHGVCVLPLAIRSLNRITQLISTYKDIKNRIKEWFGKGSAMDTQGPDKICEQVMARSAFLDLPYDVRTGQLIYGKCINNVGCPVVAGTDGKVLNVFVSKDKGLEGSTSAIASYNKDGNTFFIIIQSAPAQYNSKLDEIAAANKKLQEITSSNNNLDLQKQARDALDNANGDLSELSYNWGVALFGKDDWDEYKESLSNVAKIEATINSEGATASLEDQLKALEKSRADERKTSKILLFNSLMATDEEIQIATKNSYELHEDKVNKLRERVVSTIEKLNAQESLLQQEKLKAQKEADDAITAEEKKAALDKVAKIEKQISETTTSIGTFTEAKKALETEMKKIVDNMQVMMSDLKNQQAQIDAAAQKFTEMYLPPQWAGDEDIMKAFAQYNWLENSIKGCEKGTCTFDKEFVIIVKALSQGMPRLTSLLDNQNLDPTLRKEIYALIKDQVKLQFLSSLIYENLGDGKTIALIIKDCPDADCVTKGDISKAVDKFLETKGDKIMELSANTYWKGKTGQGFDSSFWQVWRSATAYGRAFHQLSVNIFPNGVIRKWRDTLDKWTGESVFGYVFDTKRVIQRDVCDAKFSRGSVGAYTVINYGASGILYTAAHVEGEAEEIINYSVSPPKKTGNYSYVITAGITNARNYSEGLEFDITLDDNKIIQNRTIINASQSYRLGGGAGLLFTDSTKHKEVCITFYSNPAYYFDEIFLDGNKLCNEINFYATS
jgi:hypothetical protein